MVLINSVEGGAYSDVSDINYTGAHYTITELSGNFIYLPVPIHKISLYSNGSLVSTGRYINSSGVKTFESTSYEINPSVDGKSVLIDGYVFKSTDIVKIDIIPDNSFTYSGELQDYIKNQLETIAATYSYVLIPTLYQYTVSNIIDKTYIDLATRILRYTYEKYKDNPNELNKDAPEVWNILFEGDYYGTYSLRDIDFVLANNNYNVVYTRAINILISSGHEEIHDKDHFSFDVISYVDELTEAELSPMYYSGYPII